MAGEDARVRGLPWGEIKIQINEFDVALRSVPRLG
jgi:hypothetical protein